jgi:hypothetical protein
MSSRSVFVTFAFATLAVAAAVTLSFVGSSSDAPTSSPVRTVAAPGRSVYAFQRVDPSVAPPPECIARLSCLRQFYQNLTWQEGADRALELLSEHGVASADLELQCHDTTHAIGEVAGRTEQLAAAMERGDERCGSGYYHGVIATFLTKFDPDDVVPVLASACAESKDQFNRWECFHGVGHSFVFNVNGEILRAIGSCATIAADSDRGACASGAFMQELVDNGDDADKYLADPYVVCRQVRDTTMRGQCYDMSATIILRQRVGEAAQFAVCDTVEPEHRFDCVAGLGRALFAGMPLQGPRTEEFCGATRSREEFSWCIDGVVSNTAAFYGSGVEAAVHCDEFSTADLKAACVEVLTRRWGLSAAGASKLPPGTLAEQEAAAGVVQP